MANGNQVYRQKTQTVIDYPKELLKGHTNADIFQMSKAYDLEVSQLEPYDEFAQNYSDMIPEDKMQKAYDLVATAYDLYQSNKFNPLDSRYSMEVPMSNNRLLQPKSYQASDFFTQGSPLRMKTLPGFEDIPVMSPQNYASQLNAGMDVKGKFMPLEQLKRVADENGHYLYMKTGNPEVGEPYYYWKELGDNELAPPNSIQSFWGDSNLEANSWVGSMLRGFWSGTVPLMSKGIGQMIDFVGDVADYADDGVITRNKITDGIAADMTNWGNYMNLQHMDEREGVFDNWNSFLYQLYNGIGQITGIMATSMATGGASSFLGATNSMARLIAMRSGMVLGAAEAAGMVDEEMERIGLNDYQKTALYLPFFAGTYLSEAIIPANIIFRSYGRLDRAVLRKEAQKISEKFGQRIAVGQTKTASKSLWKNYNKFSDALTQMANRGPLGRATAAGIEEGIEEYIEGVLHMGVEEFSNSYGPGVVTQLEAARMAIANSVMNQYKGIRFEPIEDQPLFIDREQGRIEGTIGKAYMMHYPDGTKRALSISQYEEIRDQLSEAKDIVEKQQLFSTQFNWDEGFMAAISSFMTFGLGGMGTAIRNRGKKKEKNIFREQAIKEAADKTGQAEVKYDQMLDGMVKRGEIGNNHKTVDGQLITYGSDAMSEAEAKKQSIRNMINGYKAEILASGLMKDKSVIDDNEDIFREVLDNMHDVTTLKRRQQTLREDPETTIGSELTESTSEDKISSLIAEKQARIDYLMRPTETGFSQVVNDGVTSAAVTKMLEQDPRLAPLFGTGADAVQAVHDFAKVFRRRKQQLAVVRQQKQSTIEDVDKLVAGIPKLKGIENVAEVSTALSDLVNTIDQAEIGLLDINTKAYNTVQNLVQDVNDQLLKHFKGGIQNKDDISQFAPEDYIGEEALGEEFTQNQGMIQDYLKTREVLKNADRFRLGQDPNLDRSVLTENILGSYNSLIKRLDDLDGEADLAQVKQLRQDVVSTMRFIRGNLALQMINESMGKPFHKFENDKIDKDTLEEADQELIEVLFGVESKEQKQFEKRKSTKEVLQPADDLIESYLQPEIEKIQKSQTLSEEEKTEKLQPLSEMVQQRLSGKFREFYQSAATDIDNRIAAIKEEMEKADAATKDALVEDLHILEEIKEDIPSTQAIDEIYKEYQQAAQTRKWGLNEIISILENHMASIEVKEKYRRAGQAHIEVAFLKEVANEQQELFEDVSDLEEASDKLSDIIYSGTDFSVEALQEVEKEILSIREKLSRKLYNNSDLARKLIKKAQDKTRDEMALLAARHNITGMIGAGRAVYTRPNDNKLISDDDYLNLEYRNGDKIVPIDFNDTFTTAEYFFAQNHDNALDHVKSFYNAWFARYNNFINELYLNPDQNFQVELNNAVKDNSYEDGEYSPSVQQRNALRLAYAIMSSSNKFVTRREAFGAKESQEYSGAGLSVPVFTLQGVNIQGEGGAGKTTVILRTLLRMIDNQNQKTDNKSKVISIAQTTEASETLSGYMDDMETMQPINNMSADDFAENTMDGKTYEADIIIIDEGSRLNSEQLRSIMAFYADKNVKFIVASDPFQSTNTKSQNNHAHIPIQEVLPRTNTITENFRTGNPDIKALQEAIKKSIVGFTNKPISFPAKTKFNPNRTQGVEYLPNKEAVVQKWIEDSKTKPEGNKRILVLAFASEVNQLRKQLSGTVNESLLKNIYYINRDEAIDNDNGTIQGKQFPYVYTAIEYNEFVSSRRDLKTGTSRGQKYLALPANEESVETTEIIDTYESASPEQKAEKQAKNKEFFKDNQAHISALASEFEYTDPVKKEKATKKKKPKTPTPPTEKKGEDQGYFEYDVANEYQGQLEVGQEKLDQDGEVVTVEKIYKASDTVETGIFRSYADVSKDGQIKQYPIEVVLGFDNYESPTHEPDIHDIDDDSIIPPGIRRSARVFANRKTKNSFRISLASSDKLYRPFFGKGHLNRKRKWMKDNESFTLKYFRQKDLVVPQKDGSFKVQANYNVILVMNGDEVLGALYQPLTSKQEFVKYKEGQRKSLVDQGEYKSQSVDLGDIDPDNTVTQYMQALNDLYAEGQKIFNSSKKDRDGGVVIGTMSNKGAMNGPVMEAENNVSLQELWYNIDFKGGVMLNKKGDAAGSLADVFVEQRARNIDGKKSNWRGLFVQATLIPGADPVHIEVQGVKYLNDVALEYRKAIDQSLGELMTLAKKADVATGKKERDLSSEFFTKLSQSNAFQHVLFNRGAFLEKDENGRYTELKQRYVPFLKYDQAKKYVDVIRGSETGQLVGLVDNLRKVIQMSASATYTNLPKRQLSGSEEITASREVKASFTTNISDIMFPTMLGQIKLETKQNAPKKGMNGKPDPTDGAPFLRKAEVASVEYVNKRHAEAYLQKIFGKDFLDGALEFTPNATLLSVDNFGHVHNFLMRLETDLSGEKVLEGIERHEAVHYALRYFVSPESYKSILGDVQRLYGENYGKDISDSQAEEFLAEVNRGVYKLDDLKGVTGLIKRFVNWISKLINGTIVYGSQARKFLFALNQGHFADQSPAYNNNPKPAFLATNKLGDFFDQESKENLGLETYEQTYNKADLLDIFGSETQYNKAQNFVRKNMIDSSPMNRYVNIISDESFDDAVISLQSEGFEMMQEKYRNAGWTQEQIQDLLDKENASDLYNTDQRTLSAFRNLKIYDEDVYFSIVKQILPQFKITSSFIEKFSGNIMQDSAEVDHNKSLSSAVQMFLASVPFQQYQVENGIIHRVKGNSDGLFVNENKLKNLLINTAISSKHPTNIQLAEGITNPVEIWFDNMHNYAKSLLVEDVENETANIIFSFLDHYFYRNTGYTALDKENQSVKMTAEQIDRVVSSNDPGATLSHYSFAFDFHRIMEEVSGMSDPQQLNKWLDSKVGKIWYAKHKASYGLIAAMYTHFMSLQKHDSAGVRMKYKKNQIIFANDNKMVTSEQSLRTKYRNNINSRFYSTDDYGTHIYNWINPKNGSKYRVHTNQISIANSKNNITPILERKGGRWIWLENLKKDGEIDGSEIARQLRFFGIFLTNPVVNTIIHGDPSVTEFDQDDAADMIGTMFSLLMADPAIADNKEHREIMRSYFGRNVTEDKVAAEELQEDEESIPTLQSFYDDFKKIARLEAHVNASIIEDWIYTPEGNKRYGIVPTNLLANTFVNTEDGFASDQLQEKYQGIIERTEKRILTGDEQALQQIQNNPNVAYDETAKKGQKIRITEMLLDPSSNVAIDRLHFSPGIASDFGGVDSKNLTKADYFNMTLYGRYLSSLMRVAKEQVLDIPLNNLSNSNQFPFVSVRFNKDNLAEANYMTVIRDKDGNITDFQVNDNVLNSLIDRKFDQRKKRMNMSLRKWAKMLSSQKELEKLTKSGNKIETYIKLLNSFQMKLNGMAAENQEKILFDLEKNGLVQNVDYIIDGEKILLGNDTRMLYKAENGFVSSYNLENYFLWNKSRNKTKVRREIFREEFVRFVGSATGMVKNVPDVVKDTFQTGAYGRPLAYKKVDSETVFNPFYEGAFFAFGLVADSVSHLTGGMDTQYKNAVDLSKRGKNVIAHGHTGMKGVRSLSDQTNVLRIQDDNFDKIKNPKLAALLKKQGMSEKDLQKFQLQDGAIYVSDLWASMYTEGMGADLAMIGFNDSAFKTTLNSIDRMSGLGQYQKSASFRLTDDMYYHDPKYFDQLMELFLTGNEHNNTEAQELLKGEVEYNLHKVYKSALSKLKKPSAALNVVKEHIIRARMLYDVDLLENTVGKIEFMSSQKVSNGNVNHMTLDEALSKSASGLLVAQENTWDEKMQLNPNQSLSSLRVTDPTQVKGIVSAGEHNKQYRDRINSAALAMGEKVFKQIRRSGGNIEELLRVIGFNTAENIEAVTALIQMMNNPKISMQLPNLKNMLLPSFVNMYNGAIKYKVTGLKMTQAPGTGLIKYYDVKTKYGNVVATQEDIESGYVEGDVKEAREMNFYEFGDGKLISPAEVTMPAVYAEEFGINTEDAPTLNQILSLEIDNEILNVRGFVKKNSKDYYRDKSDGLKKFKEFLEENFDKIGKDSFINTIEDRQFKTADDVYSYYEAFLQSLDVFATRIPTSSWGMSMVAEVTSLTYDSGSTIYISPLFNLLSDADFDIDQLTVTFRNIKYDAEKNKYLIDRIEDGSNSDAAASNTQFEAYYDAYMDPKNYDAITSKVQLEEYREYANEYNKKIDHYLHNWAEAARAHNVNHEGDNMIGSVATDIKAYNYLMQLSPEQREQFVPGLNLPTANKGTLQSLMTLAEQLQLAVDNPTEAAMSPLNINRTTAKIATAAALDMHDREKFIAFMSSPEVYHVSETVLESMSMGQQRTDATEYVQQRIADMISKNSEDFYRKQYDVILQRLKSDIAKTVDRATEAPSQKDLDEYDSKDESNKTKTVKYQQLKKQYEQDKKQLDELQQEGRDGYVKRMMKEVSDKIANYQQILNYSYKGEFISRLGTVFRLNQGLPVKEWEIYDFKEKLVFFTGHSISDLAGGATLTPNDNYKERGRYLSGADAQRGPMHRASQANIDSYVRKVLAGVLNKLEGVDLRIVSGGQSGFDEAGVKAANALGLEVTVNGVKDGKHRDRHGVDRTDPKNKQFAKMSNVQVTNDHESYRDRTIFNISEADLTIGFEVYQSAGMGLTRRVAKEKGSYFNVEHDQMTEDNIEAVVSNMFATIKNQITKREVELQNKGITAPVEFVLNIAGNGLDEVSNPKMTKYEHFMQKEKSIRGVGDIGSIIQNTSTIHSYMQMFDHLTQKLSKTFYNWSPFVNSLMDQFLETQKQTRILSADQFYSFHRRLNDAIIDSYLRNNKNPKTYKLDLTKIITSKEDLYLYPLEQYENLSIKNIDVRKYNDSHFFVYAMTDFVYRLQEKSTSISENSFVKRLSIENSRLVMRDLFTMTKDDVDHLMDEFQRLPYNIRRMFQLYNILSNGFEYSRTSLNDFIGMELMEELSEHVEMAKTKLMSSSTNAMKQSLNKYFVENAIVHDKKLQRRKPEDAAPPEYITRRMRPEYYGQKMWPYRDQTQEFDPVTGEYVNVFRTTSGMIHRLPLNYSVKSYNDAIHLSSFQDWKSWKENGKVKLNFKRFHAYEQGDVMIGPEPAVLREIDRKSVFVSKPTNTQQVKKVNYYIGNIKPSPNTVFVFGSNPQGRHDKDAAKVAVDKFGATYGQGEGLQGNAYALPTKDLTKPGTRTISEAQIIDNIKRLYEVAKENPGKQFKVAYRNTTQVSLNGYSGLEMIDMFNKAGNIPNNVVFSEEWVKTGRLNVNNKGTKESRIQGRRLNARSLQGFMDYIKGVAPNVEYVLVDNQTTHMAGNPGYIRDGVMHINEDLVSEDTPMHEFGHLLWPVLREASSEIYTEMIADAENEIESGSELAERVRELYPDYGHDALVEEVAITKFGMVSAAKVGRFTQNKSIVDGILDLVEIAWDAIKKFFQETFGQTGDIQDMSYSDMIDKIVKNLDQRVYEPYFVEATNKMRLINRESRQRKPMTSLQDFDSELLLDLDGTIDDHLNEYNVNRFYERIRSRVDRTIEVNKQKFDFTEEFADGDTNKSMKRVKERIRKEIIPLLQESDLSMINGMISWMNPDEGGIKKDKKTIKKHFGNLKFQEKNLNDILYHMTWNPSVQVMRYSEFKNLLDGDPRFADMYDEEFKGQDPIILVHHIERKDGKITNVDISIFDIAPTALHFPGKALKGNLITSAYENDRAAKRAGIDMEASLLNSRKLQLMIQMAKIMDGRQGVIQIRRAGVIEVKKDKGVNKFVPQPLNTFRLLDNLKAFKGLSTLSGMLPSKVKDLLSKPGILDSDTYHRDYLKMLQFSWQEQLETASDKKRDILSSRLAVLEDYVETESNGHALRKALIAQRRYLMKRIVNTRDFAEGTSNRDVSFRQIIHELEQDEEFRFISQVLFDLNAVTKMDARNIKAVKSGEIQLQTQGALRNYVAQNFTFNVKSKLAEISGAVLNFNNDLNIQLSKLSGAYLKESVIRGVKQYIVDDTSVKYDRLFVKENIGGQRVNTSRIHWDLNDSRTAEALRNNEITRQDIEVGEWIATKAEEFMKGLIRGDLLNVTAYYNNDGSVNEDLIKERVDEVYDESWEKGMLPVMNKAATEMLFEGNIRDAWKKIQFQIINPEMIYDEIFTLNQESDSFTTIRSLFYDQMRGAVDKSYGSNKRLQMMGLEYDGTSPVLVDDAINRSMTRNLSMIMRYLAMDSISKPIIEQEALPMLQDAYIVSKNIELTEGEDQSRTMDYLRVYSDSTIHGKHQESKIEKDHPRLTQAARMLLDLTTFNGVALSIPVGITSLTANTVESFLTAAANSISNPYNLFTMKDFAKASALFTTQYKKFKLLADMYQVYETDRQEINNNTKYDPNERHLLRANNWHIFNRATDLPARMIAMGAQMMHDGSWDAHRVVDGRIIYDPKKDKQWQGNDGKMLAGATRNELLNDSRISGQEDSVLPLRAYDLKTQKKFEWIGNELVVGTFNKTSKPAGSNWLIWKMLMQFKNFLPSKLETRLGKYKVNPEGGFRKVVEKDGKKQVVWQSLEREGSWMATKDILLSWGDTALSGAGIGRVFEAMGLVSRSRTKQELMNMNDLDKMNLARATIDLAVFALVGFLINGMVKAAKEAGDDDDDKPISMPILGDIPITPLLTKRIERILRSMKNGFYTVIAASPGQLIKDYGTPATLQMVERLYDIIFTGDIDKVTYVVPGGGSTKLMNDIITVTDRN